MLNSQNYDEFKSSQTSRVKIENMHPEKRKRVLVVGDSGMAGQEFLRQLKSKRYKINGISRTGSDIQLDVLKESKLLLDYFKKIRPDIVINCAAIVSLANCEQNPKVAKDVNSILPGRLAEYSGEIGAKFIQISTDHYYTGDKDKLHKEEDNITIINKYAETKFLGEINALSNENSLVIRTNITGYSGN